MTLDTLTNRATFNGNGATTSFATGFEFQNAVDLVVLTVDVTDPDDPIVATKILNTDYTVTGGNGLTGNVIFGVAPSATKKVVVYRNPEANQDLNLVPGEKIPVDELERRLDKGMMLIQRVQEQVERSLRRGDGDVSNTDMAMPGGTPPPGGIPMFDTTDGESIAPFSEWPTAASISEAEGNAEDAAASALAAANSATAANGSANLAALWAAKFDGAIVPAGDFSSKEYAVGVPTSGSSKDWANKTGGAVAVGEFSAKKYAQDSAASAASAATAAASAMFRDVVFKTFADSPITLVAADKGKMFAIDSSGGAIVVNLPAIASLDLSTPFVYGIKKTSSDGNTITINRASTDLINGATTKALSTPDSGTTLIPDTDPSPDAWTTADFGAAAGNLTVDTFSGNGATTGFSLSVNPGSKNNTWVYISGVLQQKSTYSLSGSTLTFSEAPPTGTSNIEVQSGTTLSIGTPADGTVTPAKIPDASITSVKAAFTLPTIQKFTSTGAQTYTRPAGVKWIRVRGVGAGSGGQGSGAAGAGGNGTAGGDSYFRVGASPDILIGNGGGVTSGNNLPGAGGGFTVNSPALDTGSFQGAGGGGGGYNGGALAGSVGGGGGSSRFGGACPTTGVNMAGVAAKANTGSGGSGGSFTDGTTSRWGGGGGGAGGYFEAIIPNPGSTYALFVGAKGTGGAAGSGGFAGGDGADGIIIVEEYYQ